MADFPETGSRKQDTGYRTTDIGLPQLMFANNGLNLSGTDTQESALKF